jgi:glyoxylase-like metal-dependent hydrolase (beta-lactamase superfamily II)/rhodanese-related sulfurtransferase
MTPLTFKESLDNVAQPARIFKHFFEDVNCMTVHAFVDEGLGHSSFLIDLGDGSAALVDPPRFPDAQEQLADRLGLRLAWTADTHSHADYVTGSPGLAARHDAVFLAPAASRLESPHRPLADGDRVELAPGIDLVAIATPGHTPDHHAYVLTRRGSPVALFSGGSLMVGAVGRTDLCGPELSEPLAHEMFHGLRRLDALPDDLALYPTHGAGSFCSAPGSEARTSTVGNERATNPLFQLTDEDEFVAQLLAGFGTFPAYFARLPELNRRGPTPYDSLPHLADLTPDEVDKLIATGAAVVDGRSIERFSAAHIRGSISNVLRPVFATWVGWLVEPDRPIVFVLDDDQPREEAVRQCLDIGYEHLAGVLVGGIEAWEASGRATARIALVGPTDARADLVDVRQSDEFAVGHVPGAKNVELGAIAATDLERRPLTVMCGHGERAMTGASVLAARGYDVDVLDGGPDSWAVATGQPLQTGA